ncbi:MAG: cyclic pyranopterin monophosphate synthase MoaC [Deltaproteobacteria bacterium]|nr:cyclic pyranopterin monophosphate synthase MoaC [Deltaproteobacteria bacterium]
MAELTHVDGEGRARMVDVGAKVPLRRRAVAAGRIELAAGTVAAIRSNALKKGDVLTVAQVAGIQAAKRCADWIPLCHPLPLTHVDVRLAVDDGGVTATAEASCTGPTGVEMEALTAVSAALLTVYDMCKAVDKAMVLEGIRLLEKTKEAP